MRGFKNISEFRSSRYITLNRYFVCITHRWSKRNEIKNMRANASRTKFFRLRGAQYRHIHIIFLFVLIICDLFAMNYLRQYMH